MGAAPILSGGGLYNIFRQSGDGSEVGTAPKRSVTLVLQALRV